VLLPWPTQSLKASVCFFTSVLRSEKNALNSNFILYSSTELADIGAVLEYRRLSVNLPRSGAPSQGGPGRAFRTHPIQRVTVLNRNDSPPAKPKKITQQKHSVAFWKKHAEAFTHHRLHAGPRDHELHLLGQHGRRGLLLDQVVAPVDLQLGF